MVGTQVSVTWAGTPGEGSITVGPVNVTAQQDLEIPLPNSVVALNLGNKDVKVSYIVTLNGTPQGSKESTLHVAAIVDGDNNLPTPSIDGAVGNELDVTLLKDSAQLRIDKWLLQALSQCIWLRYDGTDKNGKPVEYVFWAGEAHQQAEGLVTAALVAWLRELDDGTTLTITFKVNYDKVANADKAVAFPEQAYTVRAVPELIIDDRDVFLTGPKWVFHNPFYVTVPSLHPGDYADRYPDQGTPPYTFTSDNDGIATVLEQGIGRIQGTGNGTTYITVSDMCGQKKRIKVTVEGVRIIHNTSTRMLPLQAHTWREINSLRPLTDDMFASFKAAFPAINQPTPQQSFWANRFNSYYIERDEGPAFWRNIRETLNQGYRIGIGWTDTPS